MSAGAQTAEVPRRQGGKQQLDTPFGTDFGQKVDLCTRIREILRNYPEGISIMKELCQNADDAGATRVKFVLDERTWPKDTLPTPQLARFQGPALLAFNNAVFTDRDFASIQQIGGSLKKEVKGKTGRFGVGFNSVYHLTELPMFGSRDYIVMYDPSGRSLPNPNPMNPGKRIHFTSPEGQKVIQRYRDQFRPWASAFAVLGAIVEAEEREERAKLQAAEKKVQERATERERRAKKAEAAQGGKESNVVGGGLLGGWASALWGGLVGDDSPSESDSNSTTISPERKKHNAVRKPRFRRKGDGDRAGRRSQNRFLDSGLKCTNSYEDGKALTRPFRGTLFRLPLRTEAQARESRLCCSVDRATGKSSRSLIAAAL